MFLGDVEEELGEFGVVFAVAVVVVEVGERFDVVVPGLRGGYQYLRPRLM